MDTCGIWVYFKDKYSDRSAYVHCGDRQPFSAYPELRYFLCNEQDSSVYYSHIIDMRMWKPYIIWNGNQKRKIFESQSNRI